MPKYNSAPINLNPFSNTYNVTRFMESNRVNNIRYCDSLTGNALKIFKYILTRAHMY